MGVRNLVEAASRDPTLLRCVVSALEETKNTSSFFRESKDVETGEVSRWSLQVQAFSDCVVLFIPIESTTLAWLLASIRRLHDRLIRLNIPLRGGVAIGEMHWDESWDNQRAANEPVPAPIAFGQGLVSAYDLENATAVYPRILISSELYDHVDRQLRPGSIFPLGPGKLLDYFRQDFDGLFHFDVLHAALNRKDVVNETTTIDERGRPVTNYEFDETTYPEYLEMVRHFIERGGEIVRPEKLKAKYMWLGNYYNEAAKKAGCKLIPWYESLVPEGAIKMTVRPRDPR